MLNACIGNFPFASRDKPQLSVDIIERQAMMKVLVVTAVAVVMSASAYAQNYTVEEVAAVRDIERAEFIPKSVRMFQGKQTFDVVIGYTDPAQAPAGGAASRVVSYWARCGNGDDQLAIARIVIRDYRGRMMKAITVPPGAEEFVKPGASSREGDWLYRVCG